MNLLLAAILVVHPVLDEPQDLRMVAVGIGDATVTWELDGVVVAISHDREPVTVPVEAGAHELIANAASQGAWEILARPEPRGPGAHYVAGWSAKHEPVVVVESRVATWVWAMPGLLAAAALAVVPRLVHRLGGGAEPVEAAMNHLEVADTCTSTPGASRNTRTTPNSAKSSASPSSGPMTGAPSRTRTP